MMIVAVQVTSTIHTFRIRVVIVASASFNNVIQNLSVEVVLTLEISSRALTLIGSTLLTSTR